MYRVVVKSEGKYGTALGARYCFTKRSVIHLATTFIENESVFCIEKLVRIHDDIFGWSADIDAFIALWDKLPPEAEDFWE